MSSPRPLRPNPVLPPFRTWALALLLTAPLAPSALGVGLRLPAATGPSSSQAIPLLPPEVVALIHELEDIEPIEEDLDAADAVPAASPPDPGAPAVLLRTGQDELRSLIASVDRRPARHLRRALARLESAWAALATGSHDLGHLGRTIDALRRCDVELERASTRSDPGAQARIAPLRAGLVEVSGRLARALVFRADSAGVDPGRLIAASQQVDLGDVTASLGSFQVAHAHFGDGLRAAAGTITFDVELFEENIRDALAGNTTGHAFSIAFEGSFTRTARPREQPGPRPTARRPTSRRPRRCTSPA